MEDYRLYFLNRAGGISGGVSISAHDDEHAIAEGNRWRDGFSAELWRRDRKIHVYSGNPTAVGFRTPTSPARDG